MQFTRLGPTALQVSRLCLGTMNLGWVTPDDESLAMLDRAEALGINFVDTADVYGQPKGHGEALLGRWLAASAGRRERTVVATKVYGRMGPGPNEGRLSAKHIRAGCEASLRRLGTDHVDVYFLHHVDRTAPWEEVWQAIEQLVEQGKVLYAASSNFAAWHIAAMSEVGRQRRGLGLVAEQSCYNLAERTAELEVLPACRQYGIGLLPWAPLGRGLLAGDLDGATRRRGMNSVQVEVQRRGEQLAAWHALCAEVGAPPAVVGLAWLLGRPGVTGPVIGPRTVAQLDHSVAALDLALDEATLARLDAIFPGPPAEAPEAYAW